MNIRISDEALAIMKQDWGFSSGESFRIYARYASGGPEPFALNIYKEHRQNAADGIQATADGITFFMIEDDLWILDGKDLRIDANGDEIVYVKE